MSNEIRNGEFGCDQPTTTRSYKNKYLESLIEQALGLRSKYDGMTTDGGARYIRVRYESWIDFIAVCQRYCDEEDLLENTAAESLKDK